MIFVVEYTVPVEHRVEVWNALGNMTPEDHEKTQGSVKLITRYHKLPSHSGINIVEADSAEDIMKWCLHWGHLSNINVYPVLEDTETKKCIQNSLMFEKKETSESDKVEEKSAEESKSKLLFYIGYKTPVENRVSIWNAFANLSEEDESKTRGSVKMLSRYHRLTGDSGFAICESDNTEDIMKWCMHWSHLAELHVFPVLGESDAQKCVKEFMEKKL